MGVGRLVALVLAGAAAGCAIDESPAHHHLDVRGMAFEPAVVVVASGDTVTWTNRDVVPHTVTGPSGGWDSGELGDGAAFTRVMTEADTVRYVCRYHPTMEGRVVVG